MTAENRWLSVDEIATHFGIKRDTVYKWISEKGMPGHRMGRLWKFRKGEVDNWVTSGGAEESADSAEKRRREIDTTLLHQPSVKEAIL